MNANASPISTPAAVRYCCASANFARGDVSCFARNPFNVAGDRRKSFVDTAPCNGRRKEHSSLLILVIAFLAMSASAQRRGFEGRIARDPGLLLSAAPQDGQLFLSWNATPGATYRVRSRAEGTSKWSSVDVGAVSAYALSGLQNRVAYEVELEVIKRRTTRRSHVVRATPRMRSGCAALRYLPWDTRVNLFCSWEELDGFLTRERVEPETLRCRNQPVRAWSEHVPDCHYELPSGEFATLLRSADDRFAEPCGYREPEEVARVTRAILWPNGERPRLTLQPIRSFAGVVANHASVDAFRIETAAGIASRVAWFTPRTPAPNRYAIYHEGHGGRAVDIAGETIDWLLARGWTVIAMDMPLTGANIADSRPGLATHLDFDSLDDGITSPLTHFVAPVGAVVDEIVKRSAGVDPDVLLIGRSGGGWTTYLYGAIDPRIDVAVPVAGGTPISGRLAVSPAEVGDYEQSWPPLFSIIRHEDLMIAAGSRGSLHIYNQFDNCCYAVKPADPFVPFVRNAGPVFGKRIEVFVDELHYQHSIIGAAAYKRLAAFLDEVFRDPPPKVRPRRFAAAGPCGR